MRYKTRYLRHLSIEGEHKQIKVTRVDGCVELTHLQPRLQAGEDVNCAGQSCEGISLAGHVADDWLMIGWACGR